MRSEFLKFANSGAFGTAAHYAVLWALVDWLRINAVVASTAGALVGAGINYILNYHWTFKSTLPHLYTLPRFLAIAALSLVLNTLLMGFALAHTSIHYLAAQILVTSACLTVNFFASRSWAFESSSR